MIKIIILTKIILSLLFREETIRIQYVQNRDLRNKEGKIFKEIRILTIMIEVILNMKKLKKMKGSGEEITKCIILIKIIFFL